MLIVINKAYGGFDVPEEFSDFCEEFHYTPDEDVRTDPALIRIVSHGCSNPDLRVVEIPDEATDWEVNEYDGFETITYVVNGKLNHV